MARHAVELARGLGRCAILLWTMFLFLDLTVQAQDEEALQDLWKQHLGTPDDHEAVLKACHEFASAHAGDLLLPVVRGLEEWHLLESRREPEALQLLNEDLTNGAGSVNGGARRLALAWMTRLDRERVAAALQGYYRKEVAYPKSLDQVRPATFPPTDRFGKPWNYMLSGFSKVPGFTDQKYSLQSATLGEVSEFKGSLKLPYAARIQAVPVQVSAGPGGAQTVKFNVGGNAALIGVGQGAGDLYLAYVGARLIVICDYTHWKILSRP